MNEGESMRFIELEDTISSELLETIRVQQSILIEFAGFMQALAKVNEKAHYILFAENEDGEEYQDEFETSVIKAKRQYSDEMEIIEAMSKKGIYLEHLGKYLKFDPIGEIFSYDDPKKILRAIYETAGFKKAVLMVDDFKVQNVEEY